MLKKALQILLLSLWVLALPLSVWAQTQDVLSPEPVVLVEVFERIDCTHCLDARAFFDDYLKDNEGVIVTYYDLAEEENRDLWLELSELEGIPKVTPIILVGNTVVQGFGDADTTGVLLDRLIQETEPAASLTFAEFIEAGGSGELAVVEGGTCEIDGDGCVVEPALAPVKIPLIGKTIDPQAYSLGSMALILGFIDGFNPCAMWVLVTFLLVLVQIGDKRRMWQVAGLFILAEAIMYYLILNVWFQVWDFVGLDNIVTPIIGVVAIGGGIFFLWEWYTSDGTCKIVGAEKRKKTQSRIKNLVTAELTVLTAVGIIGLALSVNIIEFACSVGIPQAFTKILDINMLSFLERQMYMLAYILMYMVDDLIVFGIALYSFEKIGLTTKYSKLSNLVGGILMVILGLILLLKPELLVF